MSALNSIKKTNITPSSPSSDDIYLVEHDEFSNPNLLMNPDFKINQRGKDQYEQKSTAAIQWSVDRWALVCGYLIRPDYSRIPHTSLQLRLPSSGVYQPLNLRQYFEFPAEFRGKTLTLSFKGYYTGATAGDQLPNVRIVYHQTSIPSSYKALGRTYLNKDNSMIHTATFTVPDVDDLDKFYVEVYIHNLDANVNVYLDWIKLEYGDKATPFVTPNYQEELFRCQRYYQYIPYQLTHGLLTASRGNYYMAVTLSRPMRANISVDTTNFTPTWLGYIKTTNTGTTNFPMSLQNVSNNSQPVTFTTTSLYNKTFNVVYVVDSRSVATQDVGGTTCYDTNNAPLTYEVRNIAFIAEVS